MLTLSRRAGRSVIAPLAAVTLIATALVGCAPDEPVGEETAGPTGLTLDPALVEAAHAAAAASTAGEDLAGGKVTMIGSTAGTDGEWLKTVFGVFQEATGIEVDYQGTSDVTAIVQTQVQGGNPPDIVQDNSLALLQQYHDSGDLIAIDDFLDMDVINEQYDATLLQNLSIDGRLYGLPSAVHNMQFWYNTENLEPPADVTDFAGLIEWGEAQVADGAPAPLCIGTELGANTGVLAMLLMDFMFLKNYGPEKLEQWGRGELPFQSPEVKSVFEEFLSLFENDLVYGGADTALTTPWTQSPALLFTDPQSCQVAPYGSFAPGIIRGQNPDLVAGTDFDYFLLGSENPEWNDALLSWGWSTFALTDTPELQAFVRWYLSPEFQTLVASTGGWVMANKQIPVETYPSDIQGAIASDLQSASALSFGLWSLLPTDVRTSVLEATVTVMRDPAQLDTQLASLDDLIAARG